MDRSKQLRSCRQLITARYGRAFLVLVMGIAAALFLPGASGSQNRQDYTFHWCVRTQRNFLNKTGVDWAARMNFAQAPIRRDTVVLYQHRIGFFPQAGPHLIRQDPTWMDRHRFKIKDDLAALIPDPNFNGIAILDFEKWHLLWDRTRDDPSSDPSPTALDNDYKTDWEEQILSANPRVFDRLSDKQKEHLLKITYEETTRDFYLATLNECRRLRPKAKWGFFNYPTFYGPHVSNHVKQLNEQLAWLWEAVDVLIPSTYARFYTHVETSQPGDERFENTIEADRKWILARVGEAVRLAAGKPVYTIMWIRYEQPLGGGKYGSKHFQLLNDVNLNHQLNLPREAGADGVIIWESLSSDFIVKQVQQYINKKLAPEVIKASGSVRTFHAPDPK